jgi:hypothetical protein
MLGNGPVMVGRKKGEKRKRKKKEREYFSK